MAKSTEARVYRSEIAAAVHQTVEGFYKAGLMSRQTMREFDGSCLAFAPPLDADQIRALREREEVSQSVLARYLNVSPHLVSDWERGVKRPGGPALRLLSIIERKGLEAVA